MSTRRFATTLVAAFVAATALTVGTEASAQDRAACGHPALTHGAPCAAPALDPNTFLVQPPATTHWLARGGHANGDHPAVVVARLQRQAGVDANTFLVQPPVAVVWTVQEPATLLAATTPAR